MLESERNLLACFSVTGPNGRELFSLLSEIAMLKDRFWNPIPSRCVSFVAPTGQGRTIFI